MRGFLFSLDAIVAMGLLLLLTVIIAGFSFSFSVDELEAKRVYYAAKDMGTMLFEAQVRDLLDLPTIQDYLAQGKLTPADYNRTVIELVGYWWTIGNVSEAGNLTGAVIDALSNGTVMGYEVVFGNDTVYRKAAPQRRVLAKTTALISGFNLGTNPTGFVASAFATGVKKNTTLVFPLSPEGSAVENGEDMEITKKFYLNATEILQIRNATLYISIHFGNQDVNAQKFRVNGNTYQGSSVNWLHSATKVINGKTTQLYFGTVDVKSALVNGAWNTLEVELTGNQEWNSHIHPGFRLELDIQRNDSSLFAPPVLNETIYFDHLESEGQGSNKKSGTWAILPFHVPKGVGLSEVNATLFVRGQGVNNVSAASIPPTVPNAYNIQIYLNNLTLALANPPSLNPSTELEVNFTFDLRGNLTEGTNIVSVYLNAYNDSFWGLEDTILYADPQNDPLGSSRLVLTFAKPPIQRRIGQIEVGLKEELGGIRENPKLYNKSFNSTEISRAYLHLAQLDSVNVSVNVTVLGAATRIFSTPRYAATPSTLFVDPAVLSLTENNTLTIRDDCTDQCDILPQSGFEYFLWIPSQVGYGQLFPNSSAASQDALSRLAALMGQYAQVTEFVNETQVIPHVPTLWGPLRMEVRAWI